MVPGRSTRSLGVIKNMRLTPSISKNVPGDEVPLRVPHEFRSVVDVKQLKAGPYVVIAFPAMRSSSASIVDSSAIARAIARTEGAPGTLVAVAHSLTEEAKQLLDERAAVYFIQHDFLWTDAALASVHNKERR